MARSALTSPITQELTRLPPPGIIGARAEEIGESRIGVQDGSDGAKNVTRTFRVFTKGKWDNPIQTIANMGSANGGLNRGSIFPTSGGWGDGTYVLYYFTILNHLDGTNIWIVQATYVPNYVIGIQRTKWNFDIEQSMETKHVLTDRDGKGIGFPQFVRTRSEFAKFATSPLDRENVYLNLTSGTNPYDPKLPRYMTGADVPMRASTITFTKVINGWDLNAVQGALNGKGLINGDELIVDTTAQQNKVSFAPAPPPTDVWGGIAMLSGVSVRSIVNPNGGLFPAYQIQITIKINPDGWQLRRFVMYRNSEEGTESPVRWRSAGEIDGYAHEQNEVVMERYHLNDPISLSAILGAFT